MDYGVRGPLGTARPATAVNCDDGLANESFCASYRAMIVRAADWRKPDSSMYEAAATEAIMATTQPARIRRRRTRRAFARFVSFSTNQLAASVDQSFSYNWLCSRKRT